LRDGSSSNLTSALDELRLRGPDAAELASLATRLALQGIATQSTGAATPQPSAAPRLRGWRLALVGTAVLGVGAWLLWPSMGTRGAVAPARGVAAAAASSSVASLVPPPGAGATTSTPASATPLRHADTPGGGAAADASTSATSALPPGAPPAATTPSTAAFVPPVAPADAERSAAAAAAAPGKLPTAITAQPTPHAAEATRGDTSQPSELELLRDARLALQSSPAAALQFTERHRVSYPSGKLTQERELIAISALVALGRRTAALSRASSFERAFPTSPYRKQIGELLQ
jgi:hypothetical protein